MNDIEVRIACVNAAVATSGNPNHIEQAQAYYNFVTAGPVAIAAEEAPQEEATTPARRSVRK